LGVVRVGLEPDRKSGEIAFIVADPWQGFGLGTKMVDHMIDVCKDMGVETLYAIMLPDNMRAINLMKKMGFTIKHVDDDTVKGTLSLKEESEVQCETPKGGESQNQEQKKQALEE
jgi:acetyltransferase